MLRTRITENIRVLEDFSNLSEQGRSRADYSNQLLKDFCACRSIIATPGFIHVFANTAAKTTDTANSWRKN
jgi:hypothetical protein